MSLVFNGNTTIDNITFNGQDVEHLVYNGVEVWSKTPAIDYTKEYLTFEALENGYIYIKRAQNSVFVSNCKLFYSKNGGSWIQLNGGTGSAQIWGTISVSTGDKVRFYASRTSWALNNSTQYNYIQTTGLVNIYGNLRSLVDGENFANVSVTYNMPALAFFKFFRDCKPVDCSNLIIEAYSITGSQAMYQLFYNITTLEHGPHFLITFTISQANALGQAFKGCTSLKDIIIEVTDKTSVDCGVGYSGGYTMIEMFNGCTALEHVELLFNLRSVNTTGSTADFYRMFYNCTSLKYLKFTPTSYTNVSQFSTGSSGIFYQWMTNCPNTSSCKWVRLSGNTYKNKIVPSNWTIENISQ